MAKSPGHDLVAAGRDEVSSTATQFLAFTETGTRVKTQRQTAVAFGSALSALIRYRGPLGRFTRGSCSRFTSKRLADESLVVGDTVASL